MANKSAKQAAIAAPTAPTDKDNNAPQGEVGAQPQRFAQQVIHGYFLEHVQEFRDLHELREKGWNNSKATTHFTQQRHKADTSSRNRATFFFTMMQKIAAEMDAATGAFTLARPHDHAEQPPPSVLDLCMAPGGFVAAALARLPPTTRVRAFTLPVEEGGHAVLLPRREMEERCVVDYVDVTMLAGEMGLGSADEVLVGHDDRGLFRLERVLGEGEAFDVVFCDGQVLRTQPRGEWRESREATRLMAVQLAMGLEHVREGGTMVVLLHKLEAYRNLRFAAWLDRVAEVRLFKPTVAHGTRSSFYLVAKGVRKGEPLVAELVQTWKEQWRIATFGTEEEHREASEASEDDAVALLEEFGEKAVRMGRGIWGAQAEALSKAPWMK